MQSVIFTAVLALAAAPAEAPPSNAEVVAKLAGELADATMHEDFAKVIDLSYHTLVKELGGREKAIEQSAAAMKELKSRNFLMTHFAIGQSGDFYKEGKNTFVVVPTTTEINAPAGKIELKSYLLGISSDEGKSWRFLDGAGLQEKELREKLLPPMPAKLKLPEKQSPRLVK